MNYLVISIISILIVCVFVGILLTNSKISSNVKLLGRRLTIFDPLKKTEIDLENDLKSWNLEKVNLLWRGKLYALQLELKSGEWKKIYFRPRQDQSLRLIGLLEDIAPNGKMSDE